MNYDNGNTFGNYHVNDPHNNGFLTSLVEDERNAQVRVNPSLFLRTMSGLKEGFLAPISSFFIGIQNFLKL